MKFQLNCEFCGNPSELTAGQLKEVKQNDVVLTIFTCSSCGKSRVVQVDSTRSLELLSQYKSCYKQAMKAQLKHRKCPDKVRTRAWRLKAKLDHERDRLNVKYASLFTEFEDTKEQSELM